MFQNAPPHPIDTAPPYGGGPDAALQHIDNNHRSRHILGSYNISPIRRRNLEVNLRSPLALASSTDHQHPEQKG
ncbi:hypothetical protein BJ912DRAFT_1056296 [Pholiota molesta]|nr:hypothetical protein BJ912DRAFT_1056296 [Pholiota molesta]